MSVLTQLLAPLVSAAADTGANKIIDNQDAIVAALRSYGDRGVDELAADITAAVPDHALAQRLVHGEITGTIDNLAAELKSKLDADDPVLIDALEAWLEQISAHAAGDA